MGLPSRDVKVRSADGTVLSAQVLGTGTPLVLVHGTAASQAEWMQLPPLLAQHHTVWAYDRRGRGASGDGPSWELEREVDDIRAVLAAAGETAHLLGHSFGAVCALEVVVAGASPRSLALYEPPVHVARASAGVERCVARFVAGDPEEAVATFLTDVAGVPHAEVDAFRLIDEEWKPRVERVHTIVREIQALVGLAWQPARFRSVTLPVLYIAGALTQGPAFGTQDDIAEALPHASFVTIPDQDHVAFAYDAEGFAQVVLEFTQRQDGRADGVNA